MRAAYGAPPAAAERPSGDAPASCDPVLADPPLPPVAAPVAGLGERAADAAPPERDGPPAASAAEAGVAPAPDGPEPGSEAGANGDPPTDEEAAAQPEVEHGPAAGPEASPPVQVRCFGEFVVTSGGREIIPSGDEGGIYKAWEILAFPAVQPDGAAARDKLLTAVWPDAGFERGSNRLRTELVRLRAVLARQVPGLPSEVVRNERGGLCWLDRALVASDAQRFWALCRAAPKLLPDEAKRAWQEALALYRGDLLTGRAARFYEWVEERDAGGLSLRERYREAYLRAAQRLARLHCQEAHPERAVPLYKRLLQAEPTLEDIVRDLYRCYQQLGDLSALVREERQLRQALREVYYDPEDPDDDPERYPPEPETSALFDSIRAELEARADVRPRSRRTGDRPRSPRP